MPTNAAPKQLHGPWKGATKIVIGIDIGTTQSGVAFAFLQNGASQVIHRVTRWPGQEGHNQQGKIPTLVWYDTNKKAVSFGAEAQLYTTKEQAEDNLWMLAKCFKLHLHPSVMRTKHGIKPDPLPPGVSLHQIYSDFLGYLLKHTKTYFEDRICEGKQIWGQYNPTMEVVIAHPDGWGIHEQAFLRAAAVTAGFSTTDQAASKVRFVTEAEASVHFCIHHTNLGSVLRPGIKFAVCDAGGSTVDTRLYSVISARPILKLQEERKSSCIQAGSIFVDLEVQNFLRWTLESAGLSPDKINEYTGAGIDDFISHAKCMFQDESTDCKIRIAHNGFNNPTIRVRRGHMTLSGSTVKGFFDRCVKLILESVDQLLDGLNIEHIILVGEFGDSPYLCQEFKRRYEPRGCRTNGSTAKSIADGAVIWTVASDTTLRHSWGIETMTAFDHDDPDHQERKSTILNLGCKVVPGRWRGFATKGDRPDGNAIVRIPFSLDFPSPSAELGQFELGIYTYSGDGEPLWMKNKQGGLLSNFRNAASIQMNLDNLRGVLESSISLDCTIQWQLDFNACMRFGDTALEVYLEWNQGGTMQKGPSTLISLFDEA